MSGQNLHRDLVFPSKVRFGLRSLFVFMISSASICWIVSVPYVRFKAARRSSAHMMAANALIRDLREYKDYVSSFRDSDSPLLLPLVEQPSSEKPRDKYPVPSWLKPFLSKSQLEIPLDSSIHFIEFQSDAMIHEALSSNAHFPNLKCVVVEGEISDHGWQELEQWLERHPKARSMGFRTQSVPFDLIAHRQIEEMMITRTSGKSVATPWPLARLQECERLRILYVVLSAFDSEALRDLSQCKQLRLLEIEWKSNKSATRTLGLNRDTEEVEREAEIERLQEALPDCTVWGGPIR